MKNSALISFGVDVDKFLAISAVYFDFAERVVGNEFYDLVVVAHYFNLNAVVVHVDSGERGKHAFFKNGRHLINDALFDHIFVHVVNACFNAHHGAEETYHCEQASQQKRTQPCPPKAHACLARKFVRRINERPYDSIERNGNKHYAAEQAEQEQDVESRGECVEETRDAKHKGDACQRSRCAKDAEQQTYDAHNQHEQRRHSMITRGTHSAKSNTMKQTRNALLQKLRTAGFCTIFSVCATPFMSSSLML